MCNIIFKYVLFILISDLFYKYKKTEKYLSLFFEDFNIKFELHLFFENF